MGCVRDVGQWSSATDLFEVGARRLVGGEGNLSFRQCPVLGPLQGRPQGLVADASRRGGTDRSQVSRRRLLWSPRFRGRDLARSCRELPWLPEVGAPCIQQSSEFLVRGDTWWCRRRRSAQLGRSARLRPSFESGGRAQWLSRRRLGTQPLRMVCGEANLTDVLPEAGRRLAQLVVVPLSLIHI